MPSATPRRVLGVVAALVLVAVGAVLGRLTAGSSSSGGQATPPSTPTAVPSASAPQTAASALGGPTRRQAGVAVGYPRSESGAKSAAANYLAALGGAPVLTPAQRDDLLKAISAPGSTEVATKLAETTSSSVGTELAQQVKKGQSPAVQVVPLRLRLTGTYNPDRLEVQVFNAVYIASDTGFATSGYGQASMRLTWADGDWKLASYSNAPQVGPVTVGYYAPSNGWQPANGQALGTVSDKNRQALSAGNAPTYVVP